MKCAVLYTVVSQGRVTETFAARFVSSYRQFPGGVPHELFIVCNGGPLSTERALLFAGIECKFYPRLNTPGYDLDGYADCARGPCSKYDMLCCLGESCFFHRAGWLKRLAEARERWGPGMYGPLASHVRRAHLQTTAFAISPPQLLLEYPLPLKSREDRWQFEHGERAFWRMLHHRRFAVKLVTFDGEYSPGKWRVPENVLWKGTQENVLIWCNHTERYFEASPERKRNWQRSADRPFA